MQQEAREVDSEKISGELPSRGKPLIQPLPGKEMILQSTSYTWTGHQTATGTWPKQGRTVAVDTNTIELGSRIHIEGFGWLVAEDKIPEESVRKGAKLDIYMDREADAWKWGRRDVRVVVVVVETVESVDKSGSK